jgi:hypothetical protein
MNQPESKQKSGEIFEALGSMLLIVYHFLDRKNVGISRGRGFQPN